MLLIFSAGMIEHHDQEHLMEGRVFLGLCFQSNRAHHVRRRANNQRKLAGAGSWLSTLLAIYWKQGRGDRK